MTKDEAKTQFMLNDAKSLLFHARETSRPVAKFNYTMAALPLIFAAARRLR